MSAVAGNITNQTETSVGSNAAATNRNAGPTIMSHSNELKGVLSQRPDIHAERRGE